MSETSIHTPDMGWCRMRPGTLLSFKGIRWCDIHRMYEYVFDEIKVVRREEAAEQIRDDGTPANKES